MPVSRASFGSSSVATARVVARAALVVVAMLGAGCATTDVKGREILRVAPLRRTVVVPQQASAAAPRLDAGTDALTDEELPPVAERTGAAFADAFSAQAAATTTTKTAPGEARLLTCRLRAGPGKAYTVYEARCRAALVLADAPIVEVEATAVRRVRARGVTPGEAARIAKLVRNPLLDRDDSAAALAAAARAAATLLAGGALPTDDRAPAPKRLSDDEARALAKAKLLRATSKVDQAAAALDLGRAGTPEDGVEIAAFMDDDDVVVRRAVASALGELLDPRTIDALHAHVDDEDPIVRRLVQAALLRLYAFFPDRRPPAATFFGVVDDARAAACADFAASSSIS